MAVFVLERHRHQMQLSVTDPRLGDEGLRKFAHGCGAATQNHGLDTMVMVQVGVHRRDSQFVVFVLQIGQAR